jgi:hypothetical protein
LPDDLVNFHWDPVAGAVAVGWPGVVIEELSVRPRFDGEILEFLEVPGADAGTAGDSVAGPDTGARRTKVVVDIDVDAFRRTWLDAVAAAQR